MTLPTPPPVYLVGPTAVGKTSLAISVAERLGAEIVGADAFQIYAGLDLLTAKPTPAELARVPHHLIGVVPPEENFSVARYLALARPCLADIARRGRLALVVGGAGLYVRALTDGLSPLPPVRPELRAELAAMGLPDLVARLQTLDAVAAETVDRANPRRVARAIEIVEGTGRPLADFRQDWNGSRPIENAPSSPQGFFVNCSRPELHDRIARRTATMFAGGVTEEVRNFPPARIGPTFAKTLGLAELQAVARGELPLPTARERIETGTRQYAKRQVTWFRKDPCWEPLTLEALSPEAHDAAATEIVIKIQRAPGQTGSLANC